MPSETITYMSMILLGIVVFGFFSFTLSSYSDQADSLTFETTLSDTVLKLGATISELIALGEKYSEQFTNTNTSFIMSLNIPEQINEKLYTIDFTVNDNNFVQLRGKSSDDDFTKTFSLGINNESIIFLGAIVSGIQSSPQVTYNSVNLGTPVVTLQSKA